MFTLLDYRRRVSDMYHRIRELGTDAPQAHQHFRQMRDTLFGQHPQSPLSSEQKADFNGLSYYDYDPDYCVTGHLDTDVTPVTFNMDLGADGAFTMRQVATVSVDLPTGSGSLGVYWIAGYGGGIFLPFRDATNSDTTYGGGRYLYDTIKSADLGTTDTTMRLDFNYAYHPSCCYNDDWVCPLAPPQNTLSFAVPAGERLPPIR